MASTDTHKPYVSAQKILPEITIQGIILAIVLGFLLTAANVYLGLYVGMTVSASIPAAVISMAVLRSLAKTNLSNGTNILENNWVQTAVSSGESLAAGVIFTLPALLVMNQTSNGEVGWSEFPYFKTFIIALVGGTIGVSFSISLRRIFIVKEKLPYPEGVACAEVLIAGEKGGAQVRPIFVGLAFGSLYKLCSAVVANGKYVSLGLWKHGWDGFYTLTGKLSETAAYAKSKTTFYLGAEFSPALLGVGYIVGPAIASFVFFGGLLGAVVIMPIASTLLSPTDEFLNAIINGEILTYGDYANHINGRRRMVGVGTMLVGGLYTLVVMREALFKGITEMIDATKSNVPDAKNIRTDEDLPARSIAITSAAMAIPMFFMVWIISGLLLPAILSLLIIFTAGFLFAAVAGYMAGIVGSSNNPLSGVTIIVVILTATIFALVNSLVYGGENTAELQVAVIGVAAFVACAGAISGDNLQDLKTGYILGATPWRQQIGQVVGVAAGAVAIPLVLNLLSDQILSGELEAPQAFLMASITNGILGGGMDWSMVFMGSGIAFCLIALRHTEEYVNILICAYALFFIGGFLEGAIAAFLFSGSLLVAATQWWINERGGLNISIMAVAVGMYLSLKMTIPIFIGGMIKMYIDKRFDTPLKKSRPELFKKGQDEKLASEKEKLHGPGILFASGLIAGEAIMGIGLAGMAVSGIYLGITEHPSIWLGMGAFTCGAVIMATFSMRQMNNDNFGKIEEWDFDDEIQDAEMVDEIPKKKTRKKKPNK
ncbi:MAG: oligopeptide transporter, OPT family [Methanobacteriota archaeon]|jgi:putative OPT family oligopeptide transporter|uniref:Oligopeptide transporter, OPT family n=1 Tax=Marine Group III euryarchaeote TaxID=2173149 RepID=A0A7J4GV82_9ARCH|nr:MAG: oligopeptide transporter, OPT family [Euryarchaeota archaeon]HIF37644.1 oligopeptide transporter, OPT family [Marine Group III euryarchaeote]